MDVETADEYARIEGCFRDYTAAPFCLHNHLSQLRLTRLPTDWDGLVHQEGLHRARLVGRPVDLEDDLILKGREQEILSVLSRDDLQSYGMWQFWSLQALKLPCDELDLGSNLVADCDEYIEEVMTKSSIDILSEWLPLTHVRTDFDEGLAFPPTLGRLSMLMQREAECESLSLSQEYGRFRDIMCNDPKSSYEFNHLFPCGLEKRGPNYIQSVTPPLTPLSESPSPYIPEGNVTIIDLTSEPSSPENETVDKLQRDVQLGHIDSDPAASNSPSLCTSILDMVNCPKNKYHDLEAHRVEAPLPFSSSTATQDNDLLTNIRTQVDVDDEGADEPPADFFEEAFASLLENRGVDIMRVAEQESLNSFDLVSRIPVPVMNFDVPKLKWEGLYSAKQQFQLLRSSSEWHIPRHDKDVSLESSLRWIPVLPSQGRDAAKEEPPTQSDISRKLLVFDGALLLSSATYVTNNDAVAALRPDEEEIDQLLPTQTNDVQLSATEESTSLRMVCKKRPVDSLNPQRRGTSHFLVQKPLASVLPGYQDGNATCKLLSGFMELRAVKKRRLGDKLATPADRRNAHSASCVPEPRITVLQQSRTNYLGAIVPLSVPSIVPPEEKGCFVVSLGIGRQIFQHLQRSWPAECLIDRDFSRETHQRQESKNGRNDCSFLPSNCEADIALTATAGLVVTNLLKIRQKPLPGSKSQTPLRARIHSLAQKYGCLFILVTGDDLAANVCKEQTADDVSAYADFVLFTMNLNADITTLFVSGDVNNVTQWIVAIMCRYSSLSTTHKSFLSPSESTWELFFREAGMSTIAAQVLAGTLHKEAGPAGLAQFIRMTATERAERYGRIIGSKNMIFSMSPVVEWQWS
ncbi:hypothetical protein HJFPF1_06246 [Paramyrothecium foliicola]|nr:hypothetical protein HJFPF1_06246 [Paramyrothecium foliicola]